MTFDQYRNTLVTRVNHFIQRTNDIDMIGGLMYCATQQIKGLHNIPPKMTDDLACTVQSLCMKRINQLEANRQCH